MLEDDIKKARRKVQVSQICTYRRGVFDHEDEFSLPA